MTQAGCAAGLILGMIVFLAALCLSVRMEKHRVAVVTAGIWAALFCLILPLMGAGEAATVPERVLLTAYKSLQALTANGDFPDGAEGLAAFGGFGRAYRLFLSVLYVLGPVAAAAFLLSFVYGVSSSLQWLLSRGRETWIFTSPAPAAVALAKDAAGKDRRIRAVFLNVDRERRGEASDAGIPFAFGLDKCPAGLLTRRPASVFFMDDDEDKNLTDALGFIDRFRDVNGPVMLYPFTSAQEAPLLIERKLEGVGNIRYRRIAANKTLARALVARLHRDMPALFDPERNADRPLRFLLVGCGWKGREILKALLWSSVGEGTEVVIDVVDRDSVRDRFLREHPGLREQESLGLWAYRLNFIDCADVRTLDLEREDGLLSRPEEIDCVFVALGRGGANVDTALYLRRAFDRAFIAKHGRFPAPGEATPIRVSVEDPSEADFGEEYDILPFTGAVGEGSVDTLLDPALEKAAALCHIDYKILTSDPGETAGLERLRARAEKAETLSELTILMGGHPLTKDFFREYNGDSSRVRALMKRIASPRPAAYAAELEHDRWYMYMLTEGWSRPENGVRSAPAKLHPSLKPFEELSELDKKKDELKR